MHKLVSNPVPVSSTYSELTTLLEQMGKAKFQQNIPWQTLSSKPKNPENLLNLHRDVDIQLEEVSILLEKFQEKVEENETEYNICRQEILAQEINKEATQIELLENTLNQTTNSFQNQISYFEKLLKDAKKSIDDSKTLITQGREKATLESTVNKLEEELSKAHLFVEDLQYKEKKLTEKLNKSREEYDSSLKRLKSEYESLHKQHSSLKGAYNELHSLHYSASTSVTAKQSSKEVEALKSELSRKTKAYNEAIEELSTKEEVQESLKKTIIELGEKADKYKTILDSNSFDQNKKNSQIDLTVNSLQVELNKMKTAWMRDLETLSQTRLERDSIHTQYNLLDQKFNKASVENKALKAKIEELRQESRANFEAGKVGILPDKSIKSATGSLIRLEIDYQREIETLKKTYEQELEKLNEELDWYKAKIETERQWARSLELTNKRLNQELEDMRKQTD
jgi:chromosome segregation ATPase